MSKNIKIANASYSNVPSIKVPLASGSGNAVFMETSDATATASDIANGETAYVNGVKVVGTLGFITFYTGTTDPPSSLGNDGDIYLKVAS